MAREADRASPRPWRGQEIGVAFDKGLHHPAGRAVVRLAIAAGAGARHRSMRARPAVDAMAVAPALVTEVLAGGRQDPAVAMRSPRPGNVLFLGRGATFPIAMEVLKLKELSYIPAEGDAAGEMKHGPIALIDEDMLVIGVAPWMSSSS